MIACLHNLAASKVNKIEFNVQRINLIYHQLKHLEKITQLEGSSLKLKFNNKHSYSGGQGQGLRPVSTWIKDHD